MAGALTAAIAAAFSGGGAVTTDPYFEYTTLLLPGNGTNGAQNNTFLDGSTNNFTITRNGNTTQGTFSPFSQTGWGNYFNGSGAGAGAALSFPANAAFSFSGDFTIEFWIYPLNNNNTSPSIFLMPLPGSTFLAINCQAGSYLSAFLNTSGAAFTSTDQVPAVNAWSHVALVRSGSTVKFYVNGVASSSTATNSSTLGSSTVTPFITNSSNTTACYISNFRITNGQSLYTTNFTPTTSPLTTTSQGATAGNVKLLTCQNNRFIDNSSNNFSVTLVNSPSVVAFSPFNPTASWSAATYGGSGYFDGSGDQLSAGSNSAFAFGTGAYTVEFWTYLNAAVSSTHQPCFVFNDTTGGFGFWNQDGGGLVISGRATAPNIITTNVNLVPYQWNHVAAVRVSTSSNQLFVFVNGLLIGTGTDATNWSVTGPLQIGGISLTNYYLNGFVSNLRVIKGAAVYTGAFTPPIAPLSTSGSASASAYPSTTNVNTSFASSTCSLLTNFTNAGVYDATSKNDLETVGNAQISTAISAKWGSGSMAFDGTGDGLYRPNTDLLNLGTGNFTIEFWLNFSSKTGYQTIASFGYSPIASTGWLIQTGNGDGKAVFYSTTAPSTTTVIATDTGATVNTGQWYHVAIVRNAGTTTIYRDGTSVGSGSDSTNYSSSTAVFYTGGGSNTGFNNYYLNGYLQDVRITKGIARYTANFTAPTAAFPTL